MINSYGSCWKVIKQSNYNYLVCEEVKILRKAKQMESCLIAKKEKEGKLANAASEIEENLRTSFMEGSGQW
jgi:hypothetical protein